MQQRQKQFWAYGAPRLLALAGVVIAVTLSFATASRAADCLIDGSGVIGGLPEELGKVLSDDKGTGAQEGPKFCAPAAEKANAPLKRNFKPGAYRGPITAVKGAHVPDEVVVVLRGGAAELAQLAADYGLTVRSQQFLSVLGGLVVRLGIPDQRPVALVRASLALDPLVIDATPNHIYQLNQNGALDDRYSMKLSGIVKAHEVARGRGVKIAIIDTAIDEQHPDLKGAVKARFNGLDKVPLRETSHGTVVALLAAGSGESFKGAAPEASLFSIRAFDKDEAGGLINSVYAILVGMDWALRQGVDIINMSFSGPRNILMGRAVANMLANEIVLVAAAGNGGPKAPYSYPGAFDGVFAVTAVDAKNRIYAKANHGAYVFAAAPGVDLMVPSADLKLSLKSGTSFGAALFTGICALALERRDGRDLGSLQQEMIKASEDLGAPGRDKVFGFGLLKAERFVGP